MPDANFLVIAGGIYAVFCSTFYAVTTTWACKYIAPSSVTLFMCSHPLFTAIFTYVIFGRILLFTDVLGGLGLIAGFWINHRYASAGKSYPRIMDLPPKESDDEFLMHTDDTDESDRLILPYAAYSPSHGETCST